MGGADSIANMAMPSDVYITLENNTAVVDKLYTAPADGYIFAQSDKWVQVWNEYETPTSTSHWGSGYYNSSSGVGRVFVPVRRGATISYYGGATTTAKFIYSVGSAKKLGLI